MTPKELDEYWFKKVQALEHELQVMTERADTYRAEREAARDACDVERKRADSIRDVLLNVSKERDAAIQRAERAETTLEAAKKSFRYFLDGMHEQKQTLLTKGDALAKALRNEIETLNSIAGGTYPSYFDQGDRERIVARLHSALRAWSEK